MSSLELSLLFVVASMPVVSFSSRVSYGIVLFSVPSIASGDLDRSLSLLLAECHVETGMSPSKLQ